MFRVNAVSASLLAASTVAILVLTATPGAAAQPSELDLLDAHDVVAASAPEIMDEGEPSQNVAFQSGETDGPTTTVESPVPEVNGISVSVDYAEGAPTRSGDFSVLQTPSADVVAYVQPTADGVRFLTAIASASAPSEYSYTFDVPTDTELVETHGGYRLEPPTGA